MFSFFFFNPCIYAHILNNLLLVLGFIFYSILLRSLHAAYKTLESKTFFHSWACLDGITASEMNSWTELSPPWDNWVTMETKHNSVNYGSGSFALAQVTALHNMSQECFVIFLYSWYAIHYSLWKCTWVIIFSSSRYPFHAVYFCFPFCTKMSAVGIHY